MGYSEDQNVMTTSFQNPGGLSNEARSLDELGEQIAELSAHIEAATYRLLAAIAEFDRREGWGWGFQSTAHWMTWRLGIDLVTAREKVRVARALENLPLISDAFRQARVSYSKVRAMTRVATPENEGYLLYIAENGTADHVEKLVRSYRRATSGAALDEAKRQQEERYLEVYTDDDGMMVIRGRLPPEIGCLVQKALDAAVEMIRRKDRGQRTEVTDQDLNTTEDDSAESSETSVCDCDDDSAESLADMSTVPQLRADALGLIAETVLASGLNPPERGEAYQIMVHVDAQVLEDPLEEGQSELDTGHRVSAESSRRLACDAPVVILTHGPEGNVLHVGRKTRPVSLRLWRALSSRDRTCQFPGCSRTSRLAAHHIEHWANGGETTPENLILLCRAHHWAVHEGGCRIRGQAPDGLIFIRPNGRSLPISPSPAPISKDVVDTIKACHRKQGLKISSETGLPYWNGETMDYDYAVTALMEFDDTDRGESAFVKRRRLH